MGDTVSQWIHELHCDRGGAEECVCVLAHVCVLCDYAGKVNAEQLAWAIKKGLAFHSRPEVEKATAHLPAGTPFLSSALTQWSHLWDALPHPPSDFSSPCFSFGPLYQYELEMTCVFLISHANVRFWRMKISATHPHSPIHQPTL